MYKWLIIIVGSQSSTLAVHLVKREKHRLRTLLSLISMNGLVKYLRSLRFFTGHRAFSGAS
ncbi:hypothetical protein ACP059_01370 [Bacillus cabrialesii]|uniref:hypothetical protein n=1 Tax=Bacillus cabrialesii TaxID=2487276 RepID=UPI003CF9E385